MTTDEARGAARWTDWARPGQLEEGRYGGQNGPGLEECADSGNIRQGPEELLDSGQNERGLDVSVYDAFSKTSKAKTGLLKTLAELKESLKRGTTQHLEVCR